MKRKPRTPPAVGEVFTVPYPFSRSTYEAIDCDENGINVATVPSWKVGPTSEYVQPDDTESVADAMGKCVLTVVSVHKPGKYPARVFFTRTWIAPDGKAFGKAKLRIATASAFAVLAGGYRHEFRLRGCTCDGCEWPTTDHRKQGYFTALDSADAVNAGATPVDVGVTDERA